MATTCDYCHKPLSLMRRLRGEQFCSVEHLDLYTAQQAEFALQRLAASIDDQPVTARPPALLKRLARPAGNGTSGPHEHDNGNGPREVITEEPPADRTSEQFLRVAESLSSPDPEPAPLLRRLSRPYQPPADNPPESPILRPIQPDYPMAGFVLQDAITPVAGSPGMDIAVESNLGLSDPSMPRLANSDIALPLAGLQQLNVAPSARTPLPEGETYSDVSIRTVLPELTNGQYSCEEFSSGSFVDIEVTAASPVATSAAVVQPADFGVGSASVQLSPAEIAVPDRIQPPDPLPTRSVPVRPYPGSFEQPRLLVPETHPLSPIEVRTSGAGRLFSVLPAAARIVCTPALAQDSASLCATFGPSVPSVTGGWPELPGWGLTQSFVAGAVTLPDAAPKGPGKVHPQGQQPWIGTTGRLHTPRLPAAMPHVAAPGPQFGWESARLRSGRPLPSLEASTFAMMAPAETVSLDAAPVPRPPLADWGLAGSQWANPRYGNQEADIAAIPNLAATPSALRLRELRARVSARLETSEPRLTPGRTPRPDATGLEPTVAVNSRPAAAPWDMRLTGLPGQQIAGLAHASRFVSQRTSVVGPSLPASTPDAWAQPRPDPQTSIALQSQPHLAAASISPGPLRDAHCITSELAALEPQRYSPVAIVVVPRPNYELRRAEIREEGRFVALSPNGAYRLPRIRHTGYRMPGPYPKVPRCMPDGYLVGPRTEVPPPTDELPLTWSAVRGDSATIPDLDQPAPTRLHPADYFTWPKIKTPRTERILSSREYDALLGPSVGNEPGTRRFGPARAGLQSNLPGADGFSRAGA